MTRRSFDAVLVVAFGGPEAWATLGRFSPTSSEARRVAPERVEEVAKHYGHFGGVSPLAAITRRQVEGLRAHVGDWHDHPRFIEANARQASNWRGLS